MKLPPLKYLLDRLCGWKPYRGISSLPEPTENTKGYIRSNVFMVDRPFATVLTEGKMEALIDGIPNYKFVAQVNQYRYYDFALGITFQQAALDPYALYKVIRK